MYRIVFLLLISIYTVSCAHKKNLAPVLPYYNEPSFMPQFFESKSAALAKISHTIAPFSLLNQDSVVITQSYVEHKIYVANFIFTRCGSICPVITKNLQTVSKEFNGDTSVYFLSFTVTPWIDKPHVLKTFANSYHITQQNWHFLTGPKTNIYQLARQSFFAEEEIGFTKDSSDFLHTEHCLLIDRNNRIRGIYNGTLQLDMQQLYTDIKSLQQEY